MKKDFYTVKVDQDGDMMLNILVQLAQEHPEYAIRMSRMPGVLVSLFEQFIKGSRTVSWSNDNRAVL